MTKWAHQDVLQNGPAHIKSNATKMLIVSAYAAGDSYATVTGNKVLEATVATGDFTFSTVGSSQQLQGPVGKSAIATANAPGTPDLHIVFTNGADKVLWVTDETSDIAIVNGTAYNFPTVNYTSNQPT